MSCSLSIPSLLLGILKCVCVFLNKQSLHWALGEQLKGCVQGGEAGKGGEDPPGCLLSLTDPIEDLLRAHALFGACHLSHWGAAGTGWEQAVLVPMALHKKAFTNNEALKHPENKWQQLELGSAELWWEAGWAGEQGKDLPFFLPGKGASKAMGNTPVPADCPWESQALTGP